jgi:diadenosine tetraphosphate (Ap4A) HIT family hydrolase
VAHERAASSNHQGLVNFILRTPKTVTERDWSYLTSSTSALFAATIMQLLSRLTFAKGVLLSSLSYTPISRLNEPVEPPETTPSSSASPTALCKLKQQVRDADCEYNDNPTVFGKILRGEVSCTRFDETATLLAFEDIRPRARLHALVIPKRFIPTVFDLSPADLGLLEEMRESALRVLETHQPAALRDGDFRLVFHIPPYNSVNHLHLHVLAPASLMGWFYSWVKYNPRTRWCTDWEAVQTRLEHGKAAVPYRRPFLLPL